MGTSESFIIDAYSNTYMYLANTNARIIRYYDINVVTMFYVLSFQEKKRIGQVVIIIIIIMISIAGNRISPFLSNFSHLM